MNNIVRRKPGDLLAVLIIAIGLFLVLSLLFGGEKCEPAQPYINELEADFGEYDVSYMSDEPMTYFWMLDEYNGIMLSYKVLDGKRCMVSIVTMVNGDMTKQEWR